MTGDQAFYAVSHAWAILICEAARRRGVESNAAALAQMHEALRNLDDAQAGELVEHLNCALDILGGGR